MFRMFSGPMPDPAVTAMRGSMGGPGMGGGMGWGPFGRGMGAGPFGSGMHGRMRPGIGQTFMTWPWGPTMMGWGAPQQATLNISVNDVKEFLERCIECNANVKVTNVVEQDADTITADIVTKENDSLVQRYKFDRKSGFYEPLAEKTA